MVVPGFVENASFSLRRGEILGFGGLIGAGRTELFEGIVGLRPGQGTITLDGKQVHFRDAREAMASGIVYLSEDRKGKGLLLQQNLRDQPVPRGAGEVHARIVHRRRPPRSRRSTGRSRISTSAPGAAICWRGNSPAATSRSCCSPR